MDEVGNVYYENKSLRDDIKDLCGSLVEVYSGDTIEFVHTTVKLYVPNSLSTELLPIPYLTKIIAISPKQD